MLLVFLDECISLCVGYLLEVLHQRADGIVIHVVAQALLELYAVAISHSHVVHVHTEHQAANVFGISHTGSHASPDGNLLLSLLVLPVAANHLARYAHAGADMSELDVAVSTLVEVHEVHVHGLPRNLGVILCVEMEQRLLQILQPLDPHLGRREGVHPGDDTYALVVVVGSLHHILYLLGTVGCAFIDHLDGDDATVVQTGHHLLGVSINCNNGVTSIEELCTSYPPNLIIVKCLDHNRCKF